MHTHTHTHTRACTHIHHAALTLNHTHTQPHHTHTHNTHAHRPSPPGGALYSAFRTVQAIPLPTLNSTRLQLLTGRYLKCVRRANTGAAGYGGAAAAAGVTQGYINYQRVSGVLHASTIHGLLAAAIGQSRRGVCVGSRTTAVFATAWQDLVACCEEGSTCVARWALKRGRRPQGVNKKAWTQFRSQITAS
jgi:hypothetical protein